MLREGLSFGVTDSIQAGIRVKLVDQNMQIDLTESAVSPDRRSENELKCRRLLTYEHP